MWRDDGKCGFYYLVFSPDRTGTVGQCDPDGDKPCCSSGWWGECGNTAEHCSCSSCTNYTRILRDLEESGGKQKWRYDGKCGKYYPLPDGTPGQCDPDGDKPCCDRVGNCGNASDHCSCWDCTDYKFLKRWEVSNGTVKWTFNGNCGKFYPLPDGTPGQCDPDGDKPCCNSGRDGQCGNTARHCSCWDCTDYKFLKRWEVSNGTVKWTFNGNCGKFYPLPDGTPGQCDPDGNKPCCNSGRYGQCGNTAGHCSCSDCTNYTRLYREWEESGGTQKWRYDGKCGSDYPQPDGTPGQCDPDGDKPCCSSLGDGRCGKKAEHCFCRDCTDYKLLKQWEESGGTQKWRYDGKCGSDYPLPDGTPGQCDPEGDKPCCSSLGDGRCGKKNCSCRDCTDYKLLKQWEESGGTLKWRYDGKCGSDYPLPDGTPGQCDPDGGNPCCDNFGRCGSDRTYCLCRDCVDYKVVREITKSGKNCTVAKILSGFLKLVCFDVNRNRIYYRCINGEEHYNAIYYSSNSGAYVVARDEDTKARMSKDHLFEFYSVSEVCEKDPNFYQVCGFTIKKTKTKFLCGGSISDEKVNGEHRYIESISKSHSYSLPNYVIACTTKYDRDFNRIDLDEFCDGFVDCDDGSDEAECNVNDSTVPTCHRSSGITLFDFDFEAELFLDRPEIVPIINSVRCAFFSSHPYCSNYFDQTNCSQIERVGGYCEVNGYMSTVSKFMVCFDKSSKLKQLCDDGIEKECISPSTSDCRVHKHMMCNGEMDCSDGSDETDHICRVTSEQSNFACKRRFQPKSGKTRLPIAWIMDNVTDCMDGEDENSSLWVVSVCSGNAITPAEFSCENAFYCPGSDSTVLLRYLCNGVDSCGDGAENKVCTIARDFPSIDTTASMSSYFARNVCCSGDCERREFIRPWGNVFGETEIELLVPKRKVNCNKLFGEHYLYLSCMGLCMETNISCPLNGENRKLQYDSCHGKYPGRVFTLANNSFLTFVIKSEDGHNHQNFYRCSNDRCIEYNQVCDLVDDCGDMSDEIDCANNMICEDTKNSTRHQFIALSQKCDGIYDCFDLSDECNESCGRQILKDWVMECVCWLMGILAVIFNSCAIFHGFTALLKDCQTAGMMKSKVLLILIALGDFLMGLYLIILSVYSSFVYREEFCKGQTEWLTGVPCLVLGVISTVGSQVSLFSMTVFSFIRMYGLLYKSMRIPGPVNKKSVAKVTFLGSAILISSLAVALIPLVPFLEDYFVQGMYYNPSYQVFIGFQTKGKHIDVLKAYYSYSNSSINQITEDMSWKDIGEKVDNMFSQNHGFLDRKPVHFYGNDGVCLFKYFVRTDDARRSRRSPGSGVEMNDPVVWTMLIVNFICFIIMTYCYIRIIRNTRQSTQTSGQCDNLQRLRENRAMERRIMVIIGTDFICWVPFIVISGLHNLGVINASTWYTSFAMTVLPLNSVINPLIYDKAIGEFIMRNITRLTGFIKSKMSLAVVAIAGLFRRRNIENEPEIIPMQIINPQRDN